MSYNANTIKFTINIRSKGPGWLADAGRFWVLELSPDQEKLRPRPGTRRRPRQPPARRDAAACCRRSRKSGQTKTCIRLT